MTKPQQPEMRRSGRVPAMDPDASEAVLSAQGRPADSGDAPMPVPPEQRRGHHPEHEQDKPDLDAFADRLGIEPDERRSRIGPLAKWIALAVAGAGTLWQLLRRLRRR